MPTLIDLSQIAIAGAMFAQEQTVNIDMTRHIVLNSIRKYHATYRQKYGETIICADAGNTWKKELFAYYKANRSHEATEDGFDWGLYFKHLKELKEEMKNCIPFRMIEVPRCEADEIIAVLARHFYEQGKQPTMIVSSDKDFRQLHTFSNVAQYSPLLSKPVVENAPDSYRSIHILKGDKGDGIPNIFSPDDIFVDPAKPRQKSFTQKRLDFYLNTPQSQWSEDDRTRYARNKTLIDLIDGIPQQWRDEIMLTYKSTQAAPRNILLNYMVKHRLRNLINSIQDFM